MYLKNLNDNAGFDRNNGPYSEDFNSMLEIGMEIYNGEFGPGRRGEKGFAALNRMLRDQIEHFEYGLEDGSFGEYKDQAKFILDNLEKAKELARKLGEKALKTGSVDDDELDNVFKHLGYTD